MSRCELWPSTMVRSDFELNCVRHLEDNSFQTRKMVFNNKVHHSSHFAIAIAAIIRIRYTYDHRITYNTRFKKSSWMLTRLYALRLIMCQK